MNTETDKWTRFADVPNIPEDAEYVALASSSKCSTGELDGRPRIQIFSKKTLGGKWPPIIGWELFRVLPKEFYWLTMMHR